MSDNLSVLLLQDLICNGSKEVLLARQNAPSLPAVFGIFRRREGQMAEGGGGGGSINGLKEGDGGDDNDDALVLALTDGTATYALSVRSSDFRGGKSADGIRELLLMKGAGGVANQFLLIDIGDGRPKIKVNIKEKDEKSGIVRLVWVGDLLPMGAAMEGGAEAGNNANALPFVKVVAGSLREARDEISASRLELRQALEDLAGWKDTATKLDKTWQEEKDDLLDRYLVLYNSVKSDLRKALSDLEEEKNKNKLHAVVQEVVPNELAARKRKGFEIDDSEEEEMWNAEEVERLARGPAVQKGGAESARRKRPHADSDHGSVSLQMRIGAPSLETDKGRSQLEVKTVDAREDHGDRAGVGGSALRVNPLTGVREIFGLGAIFDEDKNNFDAYRKKRRKKNVETVDASGTKQTGISCVAGEDSDATTDGG